MEKILIVIDKHVLEEYSKFYFDKYPRRKKFPIASPILPSLNQWMVMKRFQMNHLKQVWKEFGVWLVESLGYSNKQINKCQILIEYFFEDKRKRDADNYTPKNLFDAFTASGLLVDDNFYVVETLTIKGNFSTDNPRTEINIYFDTEDTGKKENGNS